MSQSELGDKIDTDNSVISRWETNRARVSQRYIVKLANALNTSTDYLLGETDDPQPIAENTPDMESSTLDSYQPYTRAQTENRGMLIYDLGNGKKIELPPTEASYKFLRDIAIHAVQTAVVGG